MEKLLTVVVPIYKVEKYINKCLDSLILPDGQMKLLEVICVNDGTPDNSAVMAKEYEKNFPETFKVIDKENGGHGSAWNKGVELATGKYLRFLDSDDWLTNLSEFMTRLAKFNVDMVFTDLQTVNQVDSKYNRYYSCKYAMQPDHEYNAGEYDWSKTKHVHNGFNATNFQTCTYRTSILQQFHPVFFEKMYYDDEILFVLPLCVSKSFVYFDLTLYNYLKGREGQTTDPKVLAKNIAFKVKIRKYQVEFYRKHKPASQNVDAKLRNILNSRNSHTFKLMSKYPKDQSLREMSDMYNWLQENYPEFDGGKSFLLYKKSPSRFWLMNHTIKPLYWKIVYPFYNILPMHFKMKLKRTLEN